jgi:hypothetical protein
MPKPSGAVKKGKESRANRGPKERKIGLRSVPYLVPTLDQKP